MNDSSNLYRFPEEQYRMDIVPSGDSRNKTCIIYSAMDKLILTQDTQLSNGAVYVDGNYNLIVYAENVTIRGPISFSGKKVCISSRCFGVENDSKNAPAQIDVSGAVGKYPNEPVPQLAPAQQGDKGYVATFGSQRAGGVGHTGLNGVAGDVGFNGQDGGVIEIYTESFLSDTNLKLIANGGNGGKGQKAQDGQNGGRGGDGDQTFLGFHVPGGSGGVGGVGGTGGKGGAGGKGGTIRIVSVDTNNVQIFASAIGGIGGIGGDGGTGGQGGAANTTVNDSSLPLPSGGDGGSGGIGGAAGSGGNGGTIEYSSGFSIYYIADGGVHGTPGTNGVGGNGGGAGHPYSARSHSGNQGSTPSNSEAADLSGEQGIINKLNVDGYSELVRVSAAVQRTMVLQKANLLYLAADAIMETGAYSEVATLLQWLLKVTESFETKVMPQGFSQSDINMMSGIYCKARTLATQLQIGLDFFGHRPSYVPLATFDFYNSTLSTMLGESGTFSAIEDRYLQFFNALQNGQVRMDALTNTINQFSIEANNLNDQLQATTNAINATIEQITADNCSVDNQYNILINLIEWAEKQLAALAVMAKELNIITVLSGFSDNQLAKKISDEVNKQVQWGISVVADIPALPATELVRKVDVLGGNIQSLEEGYEIGNGIITPSDPNAYKLLAAEADFEKALQPYIGLSTVQVAIDAVHQYAKFVQKRNSDIMQFNNGVAKLSSIKAQLSHNQAQLDNVKTSLAITSNPALASLTTFMSRIYQDARNETIKSLNMAARAYGFWSLKSNYSVFSKFIGLSDPSGINAATLAAAKHKIISDLEEAVEMFGTPPQEFPSKNSNSDKGILLVLSEKENPIMFKTFKTPNSQGIYELIFNLPEVRRRTLATENPLYSKANVRISKVRSWISGATVSADTSGKSILTAVITHGGNDTIVSPSDEVQYFIHEKISKNFQYDCNSMNIVQDSSFALGLGQKSLYASPGPFTTWSIRIDPKYNTGLDMSKVDSVTIEFWGTNYAFSQLQTN